jgi:hypothetical protein
MHGVRSIIGSVSCHGMAHLLMRRHMRRRSPMVPAYTVTSVPGLYPRSIQAGHELTYPMRCGRYVLVLWHNLEHPPETRISWSL